MTTSRHRKIRLSIQREGALGAAPGAKVVSAAIPLHPETLPNGSIPRTGLTSPPPSDPAAGD